MLRHTSSRPDCSVANGRVSPSPTTSSRKTSTLSTREHLYGTRAFLALIVVCALTYYKKQEYMAVRLNSLTYSNRDLITTTAFPPSSSRPTLRATAASSQREVDRQLEYHPSETIYTSSAAATTSDSNAINNSTLSGRSHLPEVVRRSLNYKYDYSVEPNISASICHKSLFGSVNLTLVMEWAAYHYLLGFDRMFIAYLEEIEDLPGFDDLLSLPYVTAYLRNGSTLVYDEQVYSHSAGYKTLMTKEEDWLDCIDNKVAANGYDWVLVTEFDEYVWFNEHRSIKQVLQEYTEKGKDYLSFGKMVYSGLQHLPASQLRTAEQGEGFTLKAFPYMSGKHYCELNSYRETTRCPWHVGLAKVMFRPDKHPGKVFKNHGYHVPMKRQQSYQFDYVTEGRLNEWRLADLPNAVMEGRASFPAYKYEEVRLKGFDAYPKQEDGSTTVYKDAGTMSFFDYVLNIAPPLPSSSSATQSSEEAIKLMM